MLSLALPKGTSLEERTLDLFARAGLEVKRPSGRSYRGRIEYGGPIQVAFYKPREIPFVVESGAFDFGLTGADWVEEADAKVEVLQSFNYAKLTNGPWRIVLAVPLEHEAQQIADLKRGLRVASEYVGIGQRFFRDAGLSVEMVHSYGATEAKIPELADAVIDVVETGSSLQHNGLRILQTIRTCTPQIIASPASAADEAKGDRILKVIRMLNSAHSGPARILMTVRVPAERLPAVVPCMPVGSWRVGVDLVDTDVSVLQGLAPRKGLPEMMDAILEAGALEVAESDVLKTVPNYPERDMPNNRSGR
ncbi:ATP phosphoribosyltransferase [Streptomyces sp. NPDC048258]|uniref:ATP phosphoribosyltransferase n=1 Tax=Streptomyces sp. NPDC048258 TaxID=3365527 RepID=UPI00371C83CC